MAEGKSSTVTEPDLVSVLRHQESFQKLVEALSHSRGAAAAGGVTPCGAALLLAALRTSLPSPRFVVVVETHTEAEDLYAALRTFAPSAPVAFFPACEEAGGRELRPQVVSERLAALRLLADPGSEALICAPIQAILSEVPPPQTLREGTVHVVLGQSFDPDRFTGRLAAFGFKRLPQVELPGDFARRGGIVDVYPFGAERPLRLEADADELCAIRSFDPATQRSVQKLTEATFVAAPFAARGICVDPARALTAYLQVGNTVVVVLEEPGVREKAFRIARHSGGSPKQCERFLGSLFRGRYLKLSRYAPSGSACTFLFAERPPLGADLDSTCALLSGYLSKGSTLFLYSSTRGDLHRLGGIFKDRGIPQDNRLRLCPGAVREGFYVSEQVGVLSSREVLGRTDRRRPVPLRGFSRPARGFFSVRPGDLVVHVAYGIGRFLGTEWVPHEGVEREFLTLQYRDGAKLYVPVTQAHLVSKYIGTDRKAPALDSLRGSLWSRRCRSVKQAVHDFASELLQIQARREAVKGFAFPPDGEWQRQLEASFPFEDTPDQHEANEAVKRDMESDRCMDRLLCGDVGYGKTEIAVRAAFKAVCGGKQVAMLVPTTVLAEQHYQTFCERLSAFPVRVEVLSRFRSPATQKEILRAVREKQVDIVVGTHRLLSGDVRFADLGLVIIDEEQRFGVAHKERFKRLRATVDILTMTATPIPRTLHMALLGLRDISNLTTPPEGRSPIKTYVCRFDPELVRRSILRELDRDGQVYFVHNYVHALPRLKRRLEEIVPEARIAIAHGQMPERHLAETMRTFVGRRIDVLLSTTIIESGLDIPTVNTLFVAEADRFGLADLHQLRGRVGRYRHQAYAYFLLPEGRPVSGDGEKRLRAIERFSDLGAGFDLALKDLEIRGAGNILGPQQSGHIAAVGYDMYCRLLKQTVRQLRQEEVHEPRPVVVSLNLPAYFPRDYIAERGERVDLYRKIAGAVSESELTECAEALRDRFGPLPAPTRCLLALQGLRIRLGLLGVTRAGREGDRPFVVCGDDVAREQSHLKPPHARQVDGTTYLLNQVVRNDAEALSVLLKWAAEALRSATTCRQSAAPLSAARHGQADV